jgi:hypothetical protein
MIDRQIHVAVKEVVSRVVSVQKDVHVVQQSEEGIAGDRLIFDGTEAGVVRDISAVRSINCSFLSIDGHELDQGEICFTSESECQLIDWLSVVDNKNGSTVILCLQPIYCHAFVPSNRGDIASC